jgi:catechol 2,3-dioxygenase-like lactoylglutathione lyase family enzyme
MRRYHGPIESAAHLRWNACDCSVSEPEERDMSTTAVRSETAIETTKARTIDMKLEVVVIPVADVERSKRFYGALGWRLDADFVGGDQFRAIQFTPPGSLCSIHFGTGITPAAPGSARGLFLVVSDIDAARADLVARGVAVGEVFHRMGPGKPSVSGRDPERHSYSSYASFDDPDGNAWLLQEVTTRLPGRVDPGDTTFTSSTELATALRRAEAAHGEHEKRTGQRDANWSDWYAEYMVSEQAGKPLPT